MTAQLDERPATGAARATLATLLCANVVLGTSETVVIGLLDVLAGDLSVSVQAAGALVTAYAVGLAVGGPLLTLATMRLDRRTVLLGSVAAFVVGNGASVLVPDHAGLMAVRVATGALHGIFLAAAFPVATSVVAPGREGRAMSAVLLGNTLAGAFGAPLGTVLGQIVGWRGTFLAVSGCGAVALVAAVLLVPHWAGRARPTRVGELPAAPDPVSTRLREALAPHVLAVLVVCILVFASSCAGWSYVVPFLREVTGVSGARVGLYLAAFGLATAAGAQVGGRLADRDAARTLTVGMAGVTLSLTGLSSFGASPVASGLLVMSLGFCTMVMAPSLQHRVVHLAGAGAPLAQSLPASAANLGVAAGAMLGGAAASNLGISAAIAAGAVVGAVGVPVAIATARLRAPSATGDAVSVASSTEVHTGVDEHATRPRHP